MGCVCIRLHDVYGNLYYVLSQCCDLITLLSQNPGVVSYKEFKAIFRRERRSVKREMFQETEHGEAGTGGDELLGLDANIPGGKFDI